MDITSRVPDVQSHMLGHTSRAGDSARFFFPFVQLVCRIRC